jgi:hypothetical protein
VKLAPRPTDVEQEAVCFAGVDQQEDIRVLELGGDPDLTKESVRPHSGGQLGTQHFHRDLAVMVQVVSVS